MFCGHIRALRCVKNNSRKICAFINNKIRSSKWDFIFFLFLRRCERRRRVSGLRKKMKSLLHSLYLVESLLCDYHHSSPHISPYTLAGQELRQLQQLTFKNCVPFLREGLCRIGSKWPSLEKNGTSLCFSVNKFRFCRD